MYVHIFIKPTSHWIQRSFKQALFWLTFSGCFSISLSFHSYTTFTPRKYCRWKQTNKYRWTVEIFLPDVSAIGVELDWAAILEILLWVFLFPLGMLMPTWWRENLGEWGCFKASNELEFSEWKLYAIICIFFHFYFCKKLGRRKTFFALQYFRVSKMFGTLNHWETGTRERERRESMT